MPEQTPDPRWPERFTASAEHDPPDRPDRTLVADRQHGPVVLDDEALDGIEQQPRRRALRQHPELGRGRIADDHDIVADRKGLAQGRDRLVQSGRV